MSANAEVEPIVNLILTNSAEFTCDITNMHAPLFDMYNPSPSKVFWKVPIMIQARWHKKHRINKKWLKRYGMKRDTIDAAATITSLTMVPECGSHELELADVMFKFSPHHLRKNIKIEYV